MKENGFEYVDMGFKSGTMWATCNVGADKPEDEGLLFQWGRVDGYKYEDENNKFKTTKQNLKDGSKSDCIPITTSGKVYNEGDILDLKDDAAHVNMGGAWQMSTYDQLEELLYNTISSVTKINGVSGMMFTSNINGNCIFIPFIQGCWNINYFSPLKFSAYIWSSQVRAFYNTGIGAHSLSCRSTNDIYIDPFYRSHGFCVRCVFKK